MRKWAVPTIIRKMSKYRKNVAAFILNEKGQILICQRSDHFKTWQLPQGGIDQGETAQEAVLRELLEEIGTNDVQIIHQLEDSISYDWPEHLYRKGYIGQEQTFFLVRLNGKIDLKNAVSEEFEEIKWINSASFKKLDSGFKTQAYQVALEKFIELFPELIC